MDHWRAHDFLPESETKPRRPKEAVESWLSEIGERPTSSVYREITKSGSLRVSCLGASWPLFCELVRAWFPADGDPRLS